MATNKIKKAVRQKTYLKALFMASSGGGKSFSTLRVAEGFAKQLEQLDGKEHGILVINTEEQRGEIYADKFNYDILELNAPYTPESYIEAIDDGLDAGYEIIIIDSLTHEWSGVGGCLHIHAQQKGKDSYMNWRNVSPRHERFMEKILNCKAHILATVRGKDAYERVENGGKVGYEKMAYGYDQRKNLEYLFHISFMIDLSSHYAHALKDNTGIFAMEHILAEKHGKLMCNWAYNTTADDVLNMKEDQQKQLDIIKAQEAQEFKDGGIYKKQAEKDLQVDLIEIQQEIISIAKDYTDSGRRQDAIDIIGGNPRQILDVKKAINIKNKLLEGRD